jgi:hypothetical protein
MNMLMRKVQRFYKIFLLILVAALASNCASTLPYRDIQKDFNDAVQADNAQTAEKLGLIISSNSQTGYENVLKKLEDKDIQSLDDRLKMNAYAMKAVAQWRTSKLTDAMNTADKGLAQKIVSPRDKIVLLIIKPLIIDQNLVNLYRRLPEPRHVSLTDYQVYAKDFADAARNLNTAADQDLPVDMVIYVCFQRWRVLKNWDIIIGSLWDGQNPISEESTRIQKRAYDETTKALGGVVLPHAIENQKKKIPEGHWLRKYIDAQGNNWLIQ